MEGNFEGDGGWTVRCVVILPRFEGTVADEIRHFPALFHLFFSPTQSPSRISVESQYLNAVAIRLYADFSGKTRANSA
jgi:hypothetical protein